MQDVFKVVGFAFVLIQYIRSTASVMIVVIIILIHDAL